MVADEPVIRTEVPDSVFDVVMAQLSHMLDSGGFWLPIALIAAIVVMQGVKAIVKELMPKGTKRRWTIFLVSFLVGYVIGIFFITGIEAAKWAVIVGLVNPMLFFGLVQYAEIKKKMVLLSLLKMRPTRLTPEGITELDQTVTFMSKR